MPSIQAMTKLIKSNGQAITETSNILNVNNYVGALPDDLSSDQLVVITSFSPTVTKFFFVAGDKFLVEKTVTATNGTSVVTKSRVVTVNTTGWQAISDLAPVGFKESERTSTNVFACRYYIEPVQYAGDRYYSTGLSLDRISSVNFCKRLIFAASDLAPVGIRDQYASMLSWGEINPKTGVAELVIPAAMDDISGLFDNAATLGPFMPNGAMPKIVTLGKIKKMSRTFHGAFNHGTTLTYSPPENAVVFGEMDVSEVTDFSYCFGNCYQANPDIEDWNVSNSAIDMTGMFWIGGGLPVRWTRDLSRWCVGKITSEPANFTLNHPMAASQKPVWGTCPVLPLPRFDATLWYSEQSMQGDNFRIYSAGVKDYAPIVYNGTSYVDVNSLFGLANILTVSDNSPMRSLFDKHNQVVFKFDVVGGGSFTVTYNFHTVFSGARQYRNDQYPNLNGYENKFKVYNGKRAKVTVKLL